MRYSLGFDSASSTWRVSQTTAHALSYALALLALYPEEQEKLYEHIKIVVPNGHSLRYVYILLQSPDRNAVGICIVVRRHAEIGIHLTLRIPHVGIRQFRSIGLSMRLFVCSHQWVFIYIYILIVACSLRECTGNSYSEIQVLVTKNTREDSSHRTCSKGNKNCNQYPGSALQPFVSIPIFLFDALIQILMSARYWKDPHKFDPSRFLGNWKCFHSFQCLYVSRIGRMHTVLICCNSCKGPCVCLGRRYESGITCGQDTGVFCGTDLPKQRHCVECHDSLNLTIQGNGHQIWHLCQCRPIRIRVPLTFR
jgi:hypothetical protein